MPLGKGKGNGMVEDWPRYLMIWASRRASTLRPQDLLEQVRGHVRAGKGKERASCLQEFQGQKIDSL